MTRPAASLRRSDPILGEFMLGWDVREFHKTIVRAPRELVWRIAMEIDMQSVPLVRGIIRLREALLLGTHGAREPRGLLEEMRALGWGTLAEQPGERIVAGAACQPWLGEVVFKAIPPALFRESAPRNHVKILWTIETRRRDAGRTELVSETRVVATDREARRRFHRYWGWARFGIVAIRWLLLPAIRRHAEQEQRHAPRARPSRS